MLALTYCFSFLRGGGQNSKIQAETDACWAHVGTFFALGRFLFALGRPLRVCWAFFAHVGRFFRVLGRSRSDFGASRDHFGGPKPHFARFCCARRLAMRKNCACAKTTVFRRFLYGFYTSQALCSSHTTTQNRSWSLSNRPSCKDCAKNASWGGFWEGLALSWASLGRLLFALGQLLASLGCFLGVSWALLGRSWLSLGCSVELQGRILAPRIVPGLVFKGFGDVPDLVLRAFHGSFDVLFATPRISSHNAFKNAVTTLCYLLRLFVSPLQRGGTCAAHPPPPEGRAERAEQ